MRLRRFEMALVDIEQLFQVAGAGRVAAFLGRAELLQMQIADAGCIETRRKLALGKSRPPRGRDRARVDHEPDAGAAQFTDHRIGLRLLVADGEERFHVSRAINSIAAAGARTLPSWIT